MLAVSPYALGHDSGVLPLPKAGRGTNAKIYSHQIYVTCIWCIIMYSTVVSSVRICNVIEICICDIITNCITDAVRVLFQYV